MTIRFKLVVWYTGMLLLLLGVFSSFVYVYMSNLMFRGERSLLKAHAAQVSAMIGITKSSIRFEGFRELYRIVNSGTLVAVFDMYGGIVATSGMPSELLKLFPRYGAIRRIKVRSERWLVYDVVKRQHGAVVAWVRCARPLKLMNRPMENLKTVMFIAIPVILLIAIAGGLFLANRALSPIDNIIATARAIGRDDLSKRIQVTNSDDEIGRLATTFNEMLDRLEDAFKKERQFTSDASHELRTPVTIISATAEEALSGSKDIEEYRSSLGVILRESNRMAHLISQLLMLSKADEKSYKLELEEVDISEMIEGVMEEFSDIAEKRGVRVEFDGLKGAKIEADQSLTTRMLINLLDNAIKYNRNDGWVKLSLNYIDGKLVLRVEDSGMGIPEEDIPRIFDRFYRADKARGRGGMGLGLSIVKWIADVHGWEIQVRSVLGKGTTFEVWFS